MTTYTQLDPRQLVEHPRNARTDLGDLTGLAASIAAQGVIEPLTVVPHGDGHMVLAGHRRRAAAIEAGLDTVPCVVRGDLATADPTSGELDQQLTMLSENVQRQNLDAVEEGRAVQQLIDLGLTPAKIATKTGLSRKHVARAAEVAKLDQGTAASVAQAGLDLQQAAVVAEYRNDPTVAADLVQAAAEGPGAFTHRVTRAKQDAERRVVYLAKETELRDAGRVIVDSESWEGDSNRRVAGLRDADGAHMDADQHRSCPGSAVYLRDDWQSPFPIEVCTDWKANGHTAAVTSTGSAKTPAADLPPAEREKQKQDRTALIEDNKAMAAANTTRRQWIRTTLLERRRGEKDILRFAVEALHTFHNEVRGWFGYSATEDEAAVCAQLGLTRPGAKATTTLTSGDVVPDARLPLQLLAHVAGAIEQTIGRDAHRFATSTVRTEMSADYAQQQTARIADWLTFLVGEGYALAPIEQRIVDAAARRDPA